MAYQARQQDETIWPAMFLGPVIIGIVEFLISSSHTLYSNGYWAGILITAIGTHVVIQHNLAKAQREGNDLLTLLSLTMYVPLAVVLYFLVNHLLYLVDIAV